ncbi:DnaJ C-terminal domain-containing protein [Streptomyces sp. NPDC049040]|uniref:caspase, EACC1-associated type n=1 Tax=Streptomyces sp. NPDC049040 TaxID=3365593 RepID=UPI00371F6A51
MTDSPFGPGRRDALLIATGQYDDPTLTALRSPGQDCVGLAGVLARPDIGGFGTEQLRDAPAHEVMRALERFFLDRSRDDLLLLHISCHGIKDDDGHLYFAARDTDRDLPASTAVPAAFLRDRMERCRARTVVVLLDCCYSGAFIPGAKGDDRIHLRDELAGHGRAVLTATSRTEYAWEGSRVESSVPQPSRFTGALIEGLATGAADLNRDGRITVTELYDYVYESLHRAGARQRPRMWADLEYQVTIARTAAARQDPVPPPAAPAPQPPPEPEPLSEREAARYPLPRTSQGEDCVIYFELDLAEASFGCTKDIRVETARVCGDCSGTGGAGGARPRMCSECSGRGLTTQTPWNPNGTTLVARPCTKCQGFGTVPRRTCPECAGDGRVVARRTLTLRFPPGVAHGTRILLAGEGEAGPGGGDPGDLYIEVVELPHPVFRREDADLYCTVAIPAAVAAAGGTAQVDTLDGRKTVRVRKGIRDGQSLRLPGLGVLHLHGDGARGDLYAQVEIRG